MIGSPALVHPTRPDVVRSPVASHDDTAVSPSAATFAPLVVNAPAGSARIDVLQLLRGIAALIVVMFHASVYLTPSPDDELARWLLKSGASGVDLFFCISGFVMVYTTRLSHQRSAVDFVIKRSTRILPTYLVLTLVYAFVMSTTFRLTGFHDPNYHIKYHDITRSLFFIPLDMSVPSEAPMWGTASLHVGWTLNYEVYFYSFFAFSLLFGRARWVALFSWVFLTLLAIPLILKRSFSVDAYSSYDLSPAYLNLMTSPLIWEFVLGVVICFIYLSPIRIKSREAAWTAVVAAAALTIWVLFDGDNPGFGVPRWGWAFAVSFLALIVADKTLSIRVHPAFLWLGKVSFSLYLVHPIIVESVGITLLQFDRLRPMLVGMPYVLFLTALCLIAAGISYRWLEVRLSGWLRMTFEKALNPGMT